MDAPRVMLHTPAGAGGIAVVLLAGAEVRELAGRLLDDERRRRFEQLPPDRLMLADLRDDGEVFDEAILAVRSAEGPNEELIEIHTHGGPRIAQRLMHRLIAAGAAPAEGPAAAELDRICWNPAAEGLDNPAVGADLLQALPKARTRLAVRMLTAQWTGGLSALVRSTLAATEAGGAMLAANLADRAAALREAARRLFQIRRLLEPPEIVLAGPPNAGKSSLANALLGREACIVTDAPGATRDWVRELADVAGLAAWVTDTAGLWASDDAIDAEAIRRSWQRIDRADLVLAIFDAGNPPDPDDPAWAKLLAEPNVLRVANKIDRGGHLPGCVNVSAATGEQIDELRCVILADFGLEHLTPDTPAAFTQRQAELLGKAADAIEYGDSASAAGHLEELLG